jgi:hypothetical protein
MAPAQILSVVYEGTEYRCKQEPDANGAHVDCQGHTVVHRSVWLSADGHTIHDSTAMKCLEEARLEKRRLEHAKYTQELLAELWADQGSR